MMDHRETAADGVYRMILYNLLCFVSVPVFIFGGAVRKVAGINYLNSIMESCHGFITVRSSLLHSFTQPEATGFLISCTKNLFSTSFMG